MFGDSTDFAPRCAHHDRRNDPGQLKALADDYQRRTEKASPDMRLRHSLDRGA
jgi:hypothetical protein